MVQNNTDSNHIDNHGEQLSSAQDTVVLSGWLAGVDEVLVQTVTTEKHLPPNMGTKNANFLLSSS